MGMQVGLISCHVHEAFLLFKDTCFCALNLYVLFVSTFSIPLFPPLCIISRSTMIQNNVSMAKGHFLQHYDALLSPWHCPVLQCDRTAINLPLYIWWLPINFRPPPSVFTIVHCVCVFFREMQLFIELTYIGSRVVQ